ncbi:GTPase IMAP family member 8-like [Engraulis encrasicolus]|uniref:GTPase IMAP family member 8-like n=1 Tax=Engraulis encrasicolus TaxID=184585 RepID=UPI002FD01BFE
MAQEEPHKQHVSELRVVVLGANRSGKTSLINRILGPGHNSPRTLQTRQGEVQGRRVVMVDTVGWWRNFRLVDTAEFIKQKLQLSASMCPPGPHAFLLTVMTDIPFDYDNRRAIEEHLSLFGENIWQHAIIVFTRGGTLEGKTVEEHIESEGKALKWLVEKCGNRYCVFESKYSKDDQIPKLLEQIDAVTRVNGRRHFRLDERTQLKVQDKTRSVKEKAADRRMIKQSKTLREGKGMPSSELAILVLGWVNSKKTSAINLILNREEHFTKRTKSAEMLSGEVEGLKLSVVDTPGWWKFFPAELNPDWVKIELQRSLTVGSNAPHAVLLAVPADTTFLEEQRKITEDNMRMMFGEQVWRHTIVLFTCGDLLGDTSIEEHIEREGEPLKWVVEKCGNRYHVFDNVNTEDRSQVRDLLEIIKEIEEPNEILEMDQTLEESEMENKLAKLMNDLWEEENKQMEANAEVSSKRDGIDFLHILI